jgi:hypothetical protein
MFVNRLDPEARITELINSYNNLERTSQRTGTGWNQPQANPERRVSFCSTMVPSVVPMQVTDVRE